MNHGTTQNCSEAVIDTAIGAAVDALARDILIGLSNFDQETRQPAVSRGETNG